jgi:ABC-type uncharacterized transport system involved in gliding motility auxiliary subunit
MKKNSLETVLYSVGGVAILLVVIIAVNAIAAGFKQRIDFTREKAYTLSAGTRNILQKLEKPVKVRFYVTSSGENEAEAVMFKTYSQHVSDLLEEFKQAAHGKIILERFDPKPDSDAEDSAHLDGVDGEMLRNGEKFYMGVCVSRLDTKESIPFLDPSRERLLEYDLARAISRVENPDRPVVGVMSPLPVFGSPANPMMEQMGRESGSKPWQFITELKQDYSVREIPMNTNRIDEDIKCLLVIHPKDITDAGQYAIDQFIMRGGKVVAWLDSTSLIDSRQSNPMMGQMPGGGSSLDKLLKAWGLQFDSAKTVADMNYKVQLMGRDNQPTEAPTFLNLNEDAINRDDVATSEIKDVWYPSGGAFTGTPVSGLKETVLVKSSKESQLVDGMMAAFSGDSIIKEFKPSETEYALALRLSGKFKSAFPDGPPKDPSDTNAVSKSTEPSLKESARDTAVVLFGDADMLADQFSIRQRMTIFGPMGYEAMNGNLALTQNLVDQMAGDSDLITVRSRATLDRPFTRILEMQAKAQERYQSKINEFEQSLQDTQQKVNELQSKKEPGQQRFILSPEQQVELEKLKKKEAEVNVQLKRERKALKAEVDSLENTLKWSNIVGMPALVAVTGIGLAFLKRKRTSAK